MRMLKVAMVLLVLASFVAAVGIITMAATVSPTMMPMTGDRGMSDMRPLPKEMTMMPNTTMGMPAKQNATMGKPAMPNATMGKPAMPNNTTKMPGMSVAKPGMLIGLDQMKSNIGDVYNGLKKSVKMPGSAVGGPALGVKSKAGQMMSGTTGKMTSGQGQSLPHGVPAPQTISKMSGMPQLGNMVKIV